MGTNKFFRNASIVVISGFVVALLTHAIHMFDNLAVGIGTSLFGTFFVSVTIIAVLERAFSAEPDAYADADVSGWGHRTDDGWGRPKH